MSYRLCLLVLAFAACSPAVAEAPPPAPESASAPRATEAVVEAPATPTTTNSSDRDLDRDLGRELGRYQLTYYWVAAEKSDDGPRNVALRDRRCKTIARVSRSFARRLRLEGTGKLQDGRTVNIGGACRCGDRCYVVVGPETPFGLGVKGRALAPFRSVAAPRHLPIGTVLYLPELDGLTVPGAPPHGGFVHDGCVVADDRGGNVRGRQLDLFTGKHPIYRAFHRHHRIDRITVYAGAERCAESNRRPPTAHRGQG